MRSDGRSGSETESSGDCHGHRHTCCWMLQETCENFHPICLLSVEVYGFMPVSLETSLKASHVGAQLLVTPVGCVRAKCYLLLHMCLHACPVGVSSQQETCDCQERLRSAELKMFGH
jgi:hypothetical protein